MLTHMPSSWHITHSSMTLPLSMNTLFDCRDAKEMKVECNTGIQACKKIESSRRRTSKKHDMHNSLIELWSNKKIWNWTTTWYCFFHYRTMRLDLASSWRQQRTVDNEVSRCSENVVVCYMKKDPGVEDDLESHLRLVNEIKSGQQRMVTTKKHGQWSE